MKYNKYIIFNIYNKYVFNTHIYNLMYILHVFIFSQTYIYVCMYLCDMYTHIYIYIHKYAYVYIYICVCVRACVCLLVMLMFISVLVGTCSRSNYQLANNMAK